MIDANLLAGHQQSVVRQASVLLCLSESERYRELLLRLATEPRLSGSADTRTRRRPSHRPHAGGGY
ncbi:MAG: hypothetical protein ACREX8_02100, partial [Gammaproteobacteria bacterium]